MADYRLTAVSPLGGYSKKFGEISLREITGKSVVTIAVPQGGNTIFEKAIKNEFKTNVPQIGFLVETNIVNGILMRFEPSKMIFIVDHESDYANKIVTEKLGATAYICEQSDGWVLLELKGEKSCLALERICAIDLDDKEFPIGKLAATVMEHMAVSVARTGENSYLLMSARSFCKSFLHALETSILYTN